MPSAMSVTHRLSADLLHSSSLFKKIGEVENQEAQAKREIRNDLSPAIQGTDRRHPRQGRGTDGVAGTPVAGAATRENRSRRVGQPVLGSFPAADRPVQSNGRRLTSSSEPCPPTVQPSAPSSDDQPLAELRAILLGPDREAWETMRQRLDNPVAARRRYRQRTGGCRPACVRRQAPPRTATAVRGSAPAFCTVQSAHAGRRAISDFRQGHPQGHRIRVGRNAAIAQPDAGTALFVAQPAVALGGHPDRQAVR